MAEKKVNWDYYILVLIFVLALGIRLYFAQQSPYFSTDEAYLTLRQVEHIKQAPFTIFNDPLSYGGRNVLFSPVYSTLLAFFTLFYPLLAVGKVIPNAFASLIVFSVYVLTRHITKNRHAALLSAFISAFIPIFIYETANSISPYSIIMPFLILFFYSLLRLGEKQRYIYYMLVSMMFIIRMHPSAFLVMGSLIIYLIITKVENLNVRKSELEIIMFCIFVGVWFQFLIYKKAFLVHGPRVIWQNIPSQLISRYFTDFSMAQAVYMIGIIPFIFGVYALYKCLFKYKNTEVYLLASFAISVIFLLFFRLIQLNIGLVCLGTVMAVLFGQSYSWLMEYLNKTKFERFKRHIALSIFIAVILTSLIPSLMAASNTLSDAPNEKEIDALVWISENTGNYSTVLGLPEEGHLITYFAKRKDVMDTNFLLIEDIDQRFQDVETIYTTSHEVKAIELLNKYSVDYIMLSKKAGIEYGIDDLRYTGDDKCFQKVYDDEVRIYKSLCIIERRES